MSYGWRLFNGRKKRRKLKRGDYVRVAIRTCDIFDMQIQCEKNDDAFYIGHGMVIRKLKMTEHDEFDALYDDFDIDIYKVLMFGRDITDTFCEHDLEPITVEQIGDEPETGFLDFV
jgi:hypothetical protein